MTTSQKQSIYYPLKVENWTDLNWSKIEKTIKVLQHRIAKAAERNDYRTVRNLQRLLKRSTAARLKAIKLVTQDSSINQMIKIDDQLWITFNKKEKLALNLTKIGLTKSFSELNYLKSKNLNDQELDCFEIISISNRAYKALWKLILSPCLKTQPNLFLNQSIIENTENLKLNTLIHQFLLKSNAKWIFYLSIDDLFKKNHQDWLLKKIPIEKNVLKRWFQDNTLNQNHLLSNSSNSYLDKELLYIFLNLSLNSLEKNIENNLTVNQNKNDHVFIKKKLNIFRYVDNMIIVGESEQELEFIKNLIIKSLDMRGLKIKEETSAIRFISEGFDFLHWHFRKYQNNKILCQISKKNLADHRKEMKYLTKKIHEPQILIPKLNKKIDQWITYHSQCHNLSKIGSSMNQYLYHCLIKWGKRRHSNKTHKWIFKNYWKHKNGRWVFSIQTKDGKLITLLNYNQVKKITFILAKNEIDYKMEKTK
uniref:Putative reverse transcriptase and intron maturase n=1 Tax=Sykidion marinum TaxID=44573 RepID=A0A1W6EGM4_SYKMA|nr:putative reverse transcriptase and intron maturase [Pseudoneochloris marina]ARK14541.1 putative reverse transcriptase and intron maturase [Pseudoneochloris marina]